MFGQVSVIQNSKVSVVQRLLYYWSPWSYNPDLGNCPLYGGVGPSELFIKEGSTVTAYAITMCYIILLWTAVILQQGSVQQVNLLVYNQ